jgi:hypothetical protein
MNSKKLTLISMVLLLVFGLFLGGKGEKVATPIKPVNKIQKIDPVDPVADITPIDHFTTAGYSILSSSGSKNGFCLSEILSMCFFMILIGSILAILAIFSTGSMGVISATGATVSIFWIVEYSIEQIPQEVKEQTTDIIGFFHETATDVINTIPTSETNDSEEDFYSGY